MNVKNRQWQASLEDRKHYKQIRKDPRKWGIRAKQAAVADDEAAKSL